jgi:magnesium chelatase family protein
LARISGPLLDRIDLHIEVPAVPYKEMRADEQGAPNSSAKHLAEAVQYRSLDRDY